MTYFNQYRDSISTVQLSPFGEEQWNRIVTYSPIYVHWTDMLMISKQRTNKNALGKLNLVDQIDLNTLKLEDELLLNELYHMRRAATVFSKEQNTNHESKGFDTEQDFHTTSLTEDYQGSSEFSHELKEPLKHQCSYIEPTLTHQQYHIKRSVLTNQTVPTQVSSKSHVKKFPNINLGPKPQASLGVQLRQSAIAREHALSTTHDHHTSTPLSASTSKRTISSAHSNYYHHHQPQYQTSHSPLSNETTPTTHPHEQLAKELSSNSLRKARAKSTHSSRSTMHMLKTKNDRKRQKQNIQLKTLLVEPWKQTFSTDVILDETIPNSLEIMHTMCGPATPFERNLRSSFHRQLNQFRTGSMNT